MDKQINQKAGAFLKKKKQRKNWEKAVGIIAAVVVFCTTYALILPAITLSASCGMQEHTHTDACYEETRVLSCGLTESEGHAHTEECYGTEEIKTLLCELEEDENHTHSDECYTMEKPLICGQEEMEEHTHTEECYTISKTLKCELTEHVHTEECYASAENTKTTISLFSVDEDVATETVENFMLWLHVTDSSAGTTTKIAGYAKNLVTWETDDSDDGLTDVLHRTDDGGHTYLIPITYFVNNYASYGYSFSEGEECPFTYKPDAAVDGTGNLQPAGYIQVDGNWYVQIQDTGNYSNPTYPRSNIYYEYDGDTEEPVQDYNKTVSKEQLTLYSGQVYTAEVYASEAENTFEDIASAQVAPPVGNLRLGTTSAFNDGGTADFSSAHYTFEGDNTAGYTVKAESGEIYLSLTTVGIPGAVSRTTTIMLEEKDNNCFGIKDKSNNICLYFWRNGKNCFDRYSTYDNTGCPFYIYKQVQSTEASSAEIPGYVQIASVSEISSDGSYLIVAEANDAYYVLYPSTASGSTDAVYSHVAKVLPSALTITAKAKGETTVTAGNKEIAVTVTDEISVNKGKTTSIQLPVGAQAEVTDETIASVVVDGTGLATITGISQGETGVTVTVDGQKYYWHITVAPSVSFELSYGNQKVTFKMVDGNGNPIEYEDVSDIAAVGNKRYIFSNKDTSADGNNVINILPEIPGYTFCKAEALIKNGTERHLDVYSVETRTDGILRYYGLPLTEFYTNGSGASEDTVNLIYVQTVKDTANHGGTTINLFDYWTVTQDAVDAPASPYREAQCTLVDKLEEGINANRGLKFKSGNGRDDSASDANKWTGSAAPCLGIVNSTLTDGYPTLTGNKNLSGYAGNSLDYLFDPNYDVYTENDDGTVSYYKASYPNVKNLLQMKDGYYYYDCTENYAEFDGTDSFTLYTSPALNTGEQKEGQFFPFNPIEDAMGLSGTNAAYDQKLNHYFGMTMSTHFMQQYGGKTSAIDANAKDTIFEFSGDDDVWIFIDGVLVADLGGIHDAASVAINFATGQVTINGSSSTTLHQAFSDAGCENSTTWSQTNTATFADGTTHRLDFFYLERGNNESNLHLKFNLVEIPATSIYKVNQYGDPVAGASFAVYKADENWNYYYTDENGNLVPEDENALYLNSTALADCTIDKSTGIISKDDENIIYPVYIGTSDSNGEMIFADNTGAPLSLSQLRERFGTHFILREINIPDGYRTISDEIRLYITSESSVGTVLQCANTYDTGVWASGTLLVSAKQTLYVNGKGLMSYYTEDEDGQINVNGTLFGVVFKYIGPIDDDGNATGLGEQKNWVPVYGSDLDGYQTVSWWNEGLDTTGQVTAAITAAIEAAQKAQDYGNVEFSLTADKTIQLYLTNLPGNVETYSRMTTNDPGKTRYTVGYYWTEGSLTKATSENTYRVLTDESEFGDNTRPEGYSPFTRTFGATIEVPNLTNRLLVQKMDEEGELVNNATFAMYNIEEVTEKTAEGDEKAISAIYYLGEDADGNEVKIYLGKDEDGDNQGKAWLQADWSAWLLNADNTGTDDAENAGAYVIDDTSGVISVTINSVNYTINPVQIDKTRYQAGEQGTASFDEMSTGGYYYVREISAPEVYQLNTTEIMVRVTDDAVLANAGTVDDGVAVARGPGYAVATLNQFTSQGKIDNTLTWIITHLKITGVSNSFDVTTKESYYSDEGVWKYIGANFADDNTPLSTERTGAYGVHLVYDPSDTANTIFNYTINEDSYAPEPTDNVTRRLYTKIGWSYLEIYQDYEYGKVESAENGAGYEKLVDEQGEDMEISGLFSRSVYIQVTNPYKSVDLTVKKADADNENLLLPGAKFVVYKQVGGEQLYYQYTEDTDTTVWVTDKNDATTLTTGSDDANKGQFKLHNLNAGTFYLEETEAPDGYSKLDNAIKFTVNFTDGEGKIGSAEWAVENTSDMNPVVEEDGITLRIPNTVITTTVAVTKVWKGSEQEITLKLYRKAKGQSEAELADTRTLSDNNEGSVEISDVISGATCTWNTKDSWEITWTKLPAYGLVDGTMTEYSWYIQEEPVDGYYTSYRKSAEELTVNTDKIFAAEAIAGDDGIKRVTVTNTSDYELPAAGGKGTAWLAVSGIALMLAAGMGELCIAKRRKNK